VTEYTGEIVDGRVLFDGEPPPDGTRVRIEVVDGDEAFWLTPEMEDEIEAAIARLDRGQFVTWDELRERLREIERGVSHAQDS
jgi:hypothetical protein